MVAFYDFIRLGCSEHASFHWKIIRTVARRIMFTVKQESNGALNVLAAKFTPACTRYRTKKWKSASTRPAREQLSSSVFFGRPNCEKNQQFEQIPQRPTGELQFPLDVRKNCRCLENYSCYSISAPMKSSWLLLPPRKVHPNDFSSLRRRLRSE